MKLAMMHVAGSLFVWVGMLAIYVQAGSTSFDLEFLAAQAQLADAALGMPLGHADRRLGGERVARVGEEQEVRLLDLHGVHPFDGRCGDSGGSAAGSTSAADGATPRARG